MDMHVTVLLSAHGSLSLSLSPYSPLRPLRDPPEAVSKHSRQMCAISARFLASDGLKLLTFSAKN